MLCLDIGTKRIGVAVSDPMGWTAQGVGVIERKTKMRDFDEIFKYIKSLQAEVLLVGLPLDPEGGIGRSAKTVLGLIDEIRAFLKERGCEISIETWDESYSTADAETHLIGADVSRKKRRKVIDKMAAQRILTDYLEFRKA
ncbi:MAG: Holliday junction resolvase RuvX [Candidatus Dadabacteria bacterium]|nr:Holliday junction resolvase RuvX [Candidatus Dadabacteria bacterium]